MTCVYTLVSVWATVFSNPKNSLLGPCNTATNNSCLPTSTTPARAWHLPALPKSKGSSLCLGSSSAMVCSRLPLLLPATTTVFKSSIPSWPNTCLLQNLLNGRCRHLPIAVFGIRSLNTQRIYRHMSSLPLKPSKYSSGSVKSAPLLHTNMLQTSQWAFATNATTTPIAYCAPSPATACFPSCQHTHKRRPQNAFYLPCSAVRPLPLSQNCSPTPKRCCATAKYLLNLEKPPPPNNPTAFTGPNPPTYSALKNFAPKGSATATIPSPTKSSRASRWKSTSLPKKTTFLTFSLPTTSLPMRVQKVIFMWGGAVAPTAL